MLNCLVTIENKLKLRICTSNLQDSTEHLNVWLIWMNGKKIHITGSQSKLNYCQFICFVNSNLI